MAKEDTKDDTKDTAAPEAAETVVSAEAIETTTAEAPVDADTKTDAKPEAKPKRKKAKRAVASGQVHVLATFNNTLVTFTDTKGNVLTSSSAGACGFRGSKKGTAYAAQVAAERAAQAAKQQFGFNKADIFIKGIGMGRDAAVRVLTNMDIQVETIQDITGVPHGGVRPRKARRV